MNKTYEVNVNNADLMFKEVYEESESIRTKNMKRLELAKDVKVNDFVIHKNEIAEYWAKIDSILLELNKVIEIKDEWAADNLYNDSICNVFGNILDVVECINSIMNEI